MSEITNIHFRTPIEVALDVDENGMTTASKLYAFLELSPSNYSKWCKTNISENEFAEENIDFIRFVIKYESGVGIKEREDYNLTAHFAKKLSVKGNSAKAEQAREYFTQLEEKAKQKAIDYSNLSPELQRAYALIESQAKIELEQKRQAAEIESIKATQKVITDTFSKDSTKDFRPWVKSCITAIAENLNYFEKSA